MAAGLLWILDASINVSMEPFRAFVADKLNVDQRTAGFAMQSFFIGIGATLANALPYIFRRLGVDERGVNAADEAVRVIFASVSYSFKIGAVAFLVCVLWTVITTKEFPPENMAEFDRKRKEHNATGAANKQKNCSCHFIVMRCARLALRLFHSRQELTVVNNDWRWDRVGLDSVHAVCDSFWLAARHTDGRVHGHL